MWIGKEDELSLIVRIIDRIFFRGWHPVEKAYFPKDHRCVLVSAVSLQRNQGLVIMAFWQSNDKGERIWYLYDPIGDDCYELEKDYDILAWRYVPKGLYYLRRRKK